MIWLLLLGSLAAILIAAEFFTNALEHLGERLGISEGVTGSLFAAVGTAMPETMVPVRALMAGTDDPVLNQEIGVGAISALLLSLLIIPVATELPENVNGVLWIRRRKDTLPVGNITGAMVFQGTMLPALGLLLTSWQPQPAVLAAYATTVAGALWLRLQASGRGLKVWHLGVSGPLYLAFLSMALSGLS